MSRLDALCDQFIAEIKAKKKDKDTPEYATKCKECNDYGYICVVRDGQEFAQMCKCERMKRNMKRIERSGLSALVERYSFENFEAQKDFQVHLKKAAQDYVENFTGRENFFIAGQSGCGKTHICTAISYELMKKGHELAYFRWRNEGAKAKRLTSDDEKYSGFMDRFKECQILYIDDFWKIKDLADLRDGDYNLAFELLDYRYGAKKATIISTEWYLSEIAGVDQAIAGRIKEGLHSQNTFAIARDISKNMRM